MGTRKKEALEQFNRDNIVNAAKELFEQKGIEKTTMDDIAKYADYSKSTIYVYFRSKEEIYNAIVSDCVSLLTKQLREFVREDSDFESSYYQLCDCLVSFEEKYPKYYSSLMGEVAMTNSRKDSTKQSETGIEELNALIYKLLLIGKEKKILKKTLELKPTVLYMWSAISGIIQVAERRRDDISRTLNMDRQEYLDYSFRTFYESLVGR